MGTHRAPTGARARAAGPAPALGPAPAVSPAPAEPPAASVVVPARDEEAVLPRLLRSLAAGVPAGTLEVIVVCNGCADGTAERAREAGVTVLETPVASKAAALNLGDGAATAFPRFYVDADVVVRGPDLLRIARVLRSGTMLAASPRPAFDLTGASRVVRDYYRIWTRLPYVGEDHLGSGVIGLSEAGRSRFDRFPDAIADDLFLYHRFDPAERGTVDGTEVTVRAARDARSLLSRKVRVYAGNDQLARLGLVVRPSAGREPAWLAAVRADPGLVGAVPAYVGVAITAKLLARRRARRGETGAWARDAGSRAA